MKKALEDIKKYDTFIYDRFEIVYGEFLVTIKFYYEIVGLKKFVHKIEIPLSNINVDYDYVKKLAFNIGLLELVSYWKSTISSNLIINCGTISAKQQEFFKKIYYHGLGEFFYLNGIDPEYDTFVTINSKGPVYDKMIDYQGYGNLICIGGGKDSCVSLSLVEKTNDTECFIINPKSVMLECAKTAGYNDDEIISVKRIIDKGLLELNEEGFLNGHTPFSAMVAFVSYLTAYLNNKKFIVLSNENSANEANVVGTKINHQYSKSYEFESDFQNYAYEFLGAHIKYYSLLRPLTEYQIGMLFAENKKFHKIFKSCNVGSKVVPWRWCCDCAKCLFVYCLLAPHLYKDELVEIFGEDLFEKETLITTFKELLGKENVKPFDCVGTFEEINYAITKTIKRIGEVELPYLLKFYKDNYYDETILAWDLEHSYNENNSLSKDEEKMIKEAIGYER